MASDKQIEANRLNAQKSTGPVTENGKAASSKNAVKHGLYSRDAVIISPHLTEDQAEYDRLPASLIAELDPQTAFQECLVARIANCLWRQRRAVIAETAQLHRQLNDADREYYYETGKYEPDVFQRRAGLNYQPAESPSEVFANLVNFKMMPDEQFAINLLRYEMRLDRQLQRAYQLLRRLKSAPEADSTRRQGAKPSGHTPARIRHSCLDARHDGPSERRENGGTPKFDETKPV